MALVEVLVPKGRLEQIITAKIQAGMKVKSVHFDLDDDGWVATFFRQGPSRPRTQGPAGVQTTFVGSPPVMPPPALPDHEMNGAIQG